MTILLTRKEQERVVLTFEQDYGKLVMAQNQTETPIMCTETIDSLLQQIEYLTRTVPFEADLLDFLAELSASIAGCATTPPLAAAA